jgi:hypothetical protein
MQYISLIPVYFDITLCVHRALVSELLEKDVVHESRFKELWGDMVALSNYSNV